MGATLGAPIVDDAHLAAANRTLPRSRAFRASTCRSRACALVTNDPISRSAAATSSTARPNASSLAREGRLKPLILRTNCCAAARMWASVAGGAKSSKGSMFGQGSVADLPRGVLREKADALDRRVRELGALRDTLRHVADCPAPSQLECPTFRRLVELAGKRGRARAAKYGPRPAPAGC